MILTKSFPKKYSTGQDDVGARMSAVFLAKVEIKEKEDSAKNKGNDINGENKTIRKMVCFYVYVNGNTFAHKEL